MTPETLLDMFVLSPVGMMEVDADGNVEVANLAARRLLTPLTKNGSIDRLFEALAEFAPGLGAKARAFDSPRGVVVEGLELMSPPRRLGVTLSVVKVAPGRFVVLASDASGLAEARYSHLRAEQHVRHIETAIRDYAMFVVSEQGFIESWNASAERIHQWTESDIVGQPFSVLLTESANSETHVKDMLGLANRNGWCEEEGNRQRRDGTTFWASTFVAALKTAEGKPNGYSVVIRDLSELRKLDEESRDDAASTTDYLTGVSTHRAFFDVATAEVARGRRYSQPLSLLLVEPDHFRELHDKHGEHFSNEWLRAIAWVCRQESRTTDVVGRVGGEEFAVLLPSTEVSGGLVLAERIRERMQRHVFHGDHQGVRCTVSVGVAELSDEISSMDKLISASEEAVEQARKSGRNLVVGYNA